jgi:TonB family protein
MIPRLLVPVKLSPISATPTDGRRRSGTILDERQLVPSEMPVRALDVTSSIPAHFPLEVIGKRFLVPREAGIGTLEMPKPGETLLPTEADERMAVPSDARPAELELVSDAQLPMEVLEREDLVTGDVFTTGQVQFMPREVGEMPRDWSWIVPAASLAGHILLVFALLGIAVLFPHREPTQAELEAASRDLGIVYLPDSMFHQPKAAPGPPGPSAKLRVDPGLMKKFAPEIAPEPAPAPVAPPTPTPRLPRELPSAPVPQSQLPNAPPDRSQQVPSIESPKPVPDAPNPTIKLPTTSPSRALEDSVRGAAGRGGTSGATFGGSMPRGTGGMGGGGGGGGDGYMGGAVQMLTPDEGVDFNSYLARVVASVRRYWYSVMPESARMGDRGRVIIDFKIMRDGSVPMPEPMLRSTSGKEPLDRAALSSIRGASPFEPLPGQFSGPYIELRFIFLYNLPLDAAQ